MKHIALLFFIFIISLDLNAMYQQRISPSPNTQILAILEEEYEGTKADLKEVKQEDAEWKSKQHLTEENLCEVADYYFFLMHRQWRMQNRIFELAKRIKSAEEQSKKFFDREELYGNDFEIRYGME